MREWTLYPAIDPPHLHGFLVSNGGQFLLTPGPGGYVQFLEEGTWLVPLRNSLQLTLLSTTTAVLLGFVYAYGADGCGRNGRQALHHRQRLFQRPTSNAEALGHLGR